MIRNDNRYRKYGNITRSQKRARTEKHMRRQTEKPYGFSTSRSLSGTMRRRRGPVYPVYSSDQAKSNVTIKIPNEDCITVKGPNGKTILTNSKKKRNNWGIRMRMSTNAAVLPHRYTNIVITARHPSKIKGLSNIIRSTVRSAFPYHDTASFVDKTNYKLFSRNSLNTKTLSFATSPGIINVVAANKRNRPDTFSFKNIDLLDLYQKSEEFQKIIQSGNYIYIDGYFCLNLPKLFCYKKGELKLRRKVLKNQQQYLLRRIIRRDPANKETVWHFIEPIRKDTTLHLRVDKHYIEKILNFRYTETFGQMLTRLMKERSCGVEKLAEKTGISPRTIERYRNDDYKDRPELTYVIAICIALQLDQLTGEDLVKLAGYTLRDSKEETVYSVLLTITSNNTVEDCNSLLRSCDLKPLTKL